MRKIFSILFLGVLLAFEGCSESSVPRGQGQVEIMAITREQQITVKNPEEPDNRLPIDGSYTIHVANEHGDAFLDKPYSEMPAKFPMEEGTAYQITAESCSEELSLTANGGLGQVRYAGGKTFDVVLGHTTYIDFTCTMVNSRVSVAFAPRFADMFTDYKAEVWDADFDPRVMTFDATATHDAPQAYFNAPSRPEQSLRLNIRVTATNKLDGTLKTFDTSVQTKAARWVKLNVNVELGDAALVLTVDDTTTIEDNNNNIDPYL